MSESGEGYLVGKVFESTFQPNYNFSIFSSFSLSKIKSPKTGQNVPNEAASSRVLLQSTFEGLTQHQIELMISHWKYVCV